jgi:HAE1 family hydrophobic/amphiphilic exporter-1
MRLKPLGQRPPIGVVVGQLRQQLAVVPGLKCYPQVPPSIRIGGQLTKALYQLSLVGSDLNELYRVSGEMERKLRALPELVDVNSDLQITSPQLRVDIDRDRAATLGVTPQQIEDTLYSAFGTRQVSTIYTPTNQYYVIMEVAPEFQRDASALSLIYLRSRFGKSVPPGCRGDAAARCGSTHGQPSGATPGGHGRRSTSSRAFRSARPRRRCRRSPNANYPPP